MLCTRSEAETTTASKDSKTIGAKIISKSVPEKPISASVKKKVPRRSKTVNVTKHSSVKASNRNCNPLRYLMSEHLKHLTPMLSSSLMASPVLLSKKKNKWKFHSPQRFQTVTTGSYPITLQTKFSIFRLLGFVFLPKPLSWLRSVAHVHIRALALIVLASLTPRNLHAC